MITKPLVLLFALAFCLGATKAFGQQIGSFENPGGSAMHIRQVNPFAASGLYWIDPDGSGAGAPFQIYADMETDGGGWTLLLNSVSGNASATTDIVTNTGTVSLLTGHTRDGSQLAINQNAQIRHTIKSGSTVFDAYYSGNYHDRLGVSSSWVRMASHTSDSLLSYHFGMYWTTATQVRDRWGGGNGAQLVGVPWYYNSLFASIPTANNWGGYTNPPYGANMPVDSYAIWARESSTVVPEPSAIGLLVMGLGAMLAASHRKGNSRTLR